MSEVTPRRAPYHNVIIKQLEKLGRTDIDPRHIEAFMRVQYRSLDALSDRDFFNEAKICIACVDQVGKEEAEKTARSEGL